MLVFFELLDYDEASLPFSTDQPVYAVEARAVSFDPDAGPYVGFIERPPILAPDGCMLALVAVTIPLYRDINGDGLVSMRIPR